MSNRLIVALSSCVLMVIAFQLTAVAQHQEKDEPSPLFTEEREAAALVFLRKNQPKLLAFVAKIKKRNRREYERVIADVFKKSEQLTELRSDDPTRHKLELKLWQADTNVHITAAQLREDPKNKLLPKQLRQSVTHLLEVRSAHLRERMRRLQRELGETAQHLKKLEDNREKIIEEHVRDLLGDKENEPPPHSDHEKEKPKRFEKRATLKEIESAVQSLFAKDVAWRKIPWKTSLLEGLHQSRATNKPVLLWIFIDRPVDDERC